MVWYCYKKNFKFHYISINSLPLYHKNLHKDNSLNSIMFLLIPLSCIWLILDMFYFKFHYVSINSYRHMWPFIQILVTLNSIMFLLIPQKSTIIKSKVTTLNSIMFLLILFQDLLLNLFPFTLNSIMFLLILIVALLVASSTSYFKFHYVSINSRVHSNSLLRFHAALNSIMFLLIRFSSTSCTCN